MSITVQETEATSATVIFVPADNNEPYSYGVIAKEEFYNGFIPSDVNDMSRCMKAVYSHTFENLESETEYVVYAYGVDGSGNSSDDAIVDVTGRAIDGDIVALFDTDTIE